MEELLTLLQSAETQLCVARGNLDRVQSLADETSELFNRCVKLIDETKQFDESLFAKKVALVIGLKTTLQAINARYKIRVSDRWLIMTDGPLKVKLDYKKGRDTLLLLECWRKFTGYLDRQGILWDFCSQAIAEINSYLEAIATDSSRGDGLENYEKVLLQIRDLKELIEA
ncbi:MAG: hypothetical protein KBC62_01620 [Candidatus Pacebacteria bacterium]|nr:hypothetical protein [Candidatus Paceibacterota bacterium]MBP9842679.1 hypothetical protein [Candidatus Paceibacterota bacterium]